MTTRTLIAKEQPIPPLLRDGDRLNQAEFHKRYQAMPTSFRAELLEGVVIVSSSVTSDHACFHSRIAGWAGLYGAEIPGVGSYLKGTTILSQDSEVQPDVFLMLSPELGGQARIGPTRMVVGAPELVAEVAYSSASYDLGVKKNIYEAAGVREYIVIALLENQVQWFRRQNDRLLATPPDTDGIHRSTIFPGLWLDPQALLADNMSRVLAVLRQGMASPEYVAFRARLG